MFGDVAAGRRWGACTSPTQSELSFVELCVKQGKSRLFLSVGRSRSANVLHS